MSFPGEQLTLHITPLDDVGDPTYGLVHLVVVEKGGPMEVSYHFTAPYTSSHHEGLRQDKTYDVLYLTKTLVVEMLYIAIIALVLLREYSPLTTVDLKP